MGCEKAGKEETLAFSVTVGYAMKTLLEVNNLVLFAGVAEWLTRWPRDLALKYIEGWIEDK